MPKYSKNVIYQLGGMALLSSYHNEAKKALKGHCGPKGRKAHWRCKKRDGSKSANPTVILSLEPTQTLTGAPTGAPTTTQSEAPSAFVLTNDNIKWTLIQWGGSKTTQVEEKLGLIAAWDVSRVTDMEGPLFKLNTPFNSDISNWDMSGVTKTSQMFQHADKFNQDIAIWDMSKVIDTTRMFHSANVFNQNISTWDMSSVTSTHQMFLASPQESNAFNQSIGGWDMSSNTDSGGMFQRCGNFNQNLSDWYMSKVTDMGNMFDNNVEFNQDLSSWNVALVTNFGAMFSAAYTFKQDLCDWDLSAGIMFSDMFAWTECPGETIKQNVSICMNCS